MWPPQRRLRHVCANAPQLRRSRRGPTLPRLPTAEREGVVIHQLEPEAASVPEARRLAGEFAGSLMSDEQRSRLELAITEVVANSVRHSGSSEGIFLKLTHKDDYLCVRVIDGGTGLVPRPG